MTLYAAVCAAMVLSACAPRPAQPATAEGLRANREASADVPPARVRVDATPANSANPTTQAKLVRQPNVSLASGKVLLEASVVSGEKVVGKARWRRLPGVESAWLALDHHPPRKFEGPQLELADLLNEDEETAPGRHRVVAVRREPTRFVIEVSEFWLETPPTSGNEAGCLLFSPRGTYNGDAEADAADVVVLTWGSRPLHVRVGFRDAVGQETALAPQVLVWKASPLPSGDFDFNLSCWNEAGAEVEALARTITVNRDAPQKLP